MEFEYQWEDKVTRRPDLKAGDIFRFSSFCNGVAFRCNVNDRFRNRVFVEVVDYYEEVFPAEAKKLPIGKVFVWPTKLTPEEIDRGIMFFPIVKEKKNYSV